MTPRALDRLARLEANAATPTTGKHLIFRVEAPRGTPVSEIVTFLKDQGHAIHEDDDVFVMNVGAYGMTEGEPPRDLSPAFLPRGCAPQPHRLSSGRGAARNSRSSSTASEICNDPKARG